MKKFLLFSLLFMLLAADQAFSQHYFDFGFERDTSLKVYDINGVEFDMAFGGGTNSAHFNTMDLNFDGILDLVSFDSHGDILKTYINLGIPNQASYVYAPEYEKFFPKMYAWMQLRDYNLDGKMDLFTFGFSGIKMYENISNPTDGIQWKLVTNLINAFQSGNYSNIIVKSVDYPVIDDVDGDSDLDILSFEGNLIKMYRNYSMEHLGHADTMYMVLEHKCWGYVIENDTTNVLTTNLDTVGVYGTWCTQVPMMQRHAKRGDRDRHVGSTMLILDLDADGDRDMLIGDVDYPNLIALHNGGTYDSAYIVSQEVDYPQTDTPIKIFSLVTADYIDVDNDNIKDLIVSSMDPIWRDFKSDNKNNVWFYKNIGQNNNPNFKLQTKSFLQGDMIDVGAAAIPAFVDYNGDSLMDIVVGQYGIRDSTYFPSWDEMISIFSSNLTLFENTGTKSVPKYKIVDEDYLGLSNSKILGMAPTFGDIDGDGDADLIIGDADGKLYLFTNSAGAGNPLNLSLTTANYLNVDVGYNAVPQLFDLNNDGLMDLIIGYRGKRWLDPYGVPYMWRASLVYYENTGTSSNPVFTHQTDTLGRIDIRDGNEHHYLGFTAPQFYRDSTGKTSLFVGAANGLIFYYNDIDSNIKGEFGKDSLLSFTTPYDVFYSVQYFKNENQLLETIDEKLRSSVALSDINDDGYPDMVLGTVTGGLRYFKGCEPMWIGIEETVIPVDKFEFKVYPNPANQSINILIPDQKNTSEIMIVLYSIDGRELYCESYRNTDFMNIDLSGFENGVYILKLISGKGKTTISSSKKIIIKK